MRCKKLAAAMAAVLVVCLLCPLRALAFSDADVKAPAALLMEAQTGKVLFEKDAHSKRPCASVTKVMTMLLVMEALDAGKIRLTDQVAASAHAASMGGSDIWLKEGEVMSVEDLLKATAVASANDAAVVLAEHISGSEESFLQQMNAKAKALGMKDTTFLNCNGLDEDGHVTSAYDVALMSRELIRHKQIFTFTNIWMEDIRGGKTQLVNTNKLLKSYKGITGLKTGTTSKAGSCISATATRDGLSLIAVVLGAPSTKERFSTAAALLDHGFAGWAMAPLKLPQGALSPVPVTNGLERQVPVHADLSGKVLVPKGKEKDVKVEVKISPSATAPVKKGQKLGEVRCTLGKDTLSTCAVTAARQVEELRFDLVFQLLLKRLFCV